MKAHPGWGVAQIGKQLGKDWKSVTSAERAPFEAKFAKAKTAYEKKLEAYKKSRNYKDFQHELLAWKIHATKKPFGADPNAPKRPTSAYMLYAASVRAEIVKANPDMEVAAVMKEQAVWWKALSEEERAPWVKKAAAAKAKHAKLMEKYTKSRSYQAYLAEKEAYKADQLAKRNKLMGVKTKRARSESVGPRKAKKAKRSARRSRTPKSSKRSARRARTPKAPKSAVTSDSEASTKKSSRRRRAH